MREKEREYRRGRGEGVQMRESVNEEEKKVKRKVKGGNKNATLHRLVSCLASFNTRNMMHIQH